ncbi:B-box zinc finger protein 22 [Bienertia sinuspersici]
MKIQCNVCETAEAMVLCCADEAALCYDCDEKVHAANKLASKQSACFSSHSSSHMPKCDIVSLSEFIDAVSSLTAFSTLYLNGHDIVWNVLQDTAGYFFCLEDRALLCRNCDIAIHTANALVSGHQRYLLTGVKVGLETAAPGSSSSGGISHSGDKGSDAENRGTLKRSIPSTTSQYERASTIQRVADTAMPSKRSLPKQVAHEFPKMQPVHSGALEDITQPRMTIAGGSAAGTLSQWPIDDFLALNDFQLNCGFPDNGSSKADDSGKLGESDSSSFLRSVEDDLDSDDRSGTGSRCFLDSAEVPSPPTASGLYWPELRSTWLIMLCLCLIYVGPGNKLSLVNTKVQC